MADAYVGEIRLFSGSYAPEGWAMCNGQILNVQSNMPLFTVIGKKYGGDGRTTFALPNMMGKVPIGQGAGPGLTPRNIADAVGESTVTLNINEMPAHTHAAIGIQNPTASNITDMPANNFWSEFPPGSGTPPEKFPLYAPKQNAQMLDKTLGSTGSTQPHNNMQKYLALNYMICLRGEYPPRG